MTGRIGSYALAAGTLAAVAATLLWLRVALGSQEVGDGTAAGPDAATARRARRSSWWALAAALTAAAALTWALVGHDFSVRYVADNGGRQVPLYYTVTSLWANQNGSLLLWLLVLCGYAVLLARTRPGKVTAAHPWAMTVVSAVAVFFFALSYFAANPFGSVRPVPPDGPGPNPLLREHPAMGVHPPLLYAGYVGMVVPFGYALAALIRGDTGRPWLEATRRWTLVSWSLLTAGITLGAWWSYAVLGWGGYWAWDPVENASLLPWLAATVLLHSTMLARRRPAISGWTVALACSTFPLVVIGTFLTRSGAVLSVHSFSQSALGPMLLGFVLLVLVCVAGLSLWRAGRFGGSGTGRPRAGEPSGLRLLSRESLLSAGTVLLVGLIAVVFTGTVFPLLTEAVTGTRASVGVSYFNRAAVPLALLVLVLMAVGPHVRWGGDDRSLAGRLALPAVAGLATVATVGLLATSSPRVLIATGVAACALASTAALTVRDLRRTLSAASREAAGGWPRALAARRRRYGGLVAHVGIALAAAGIAVSSGYGRATEQQVRVGQTVTVAGVSARLTGVDRSGGAAAGTSVTAVLSLRRHGRPIGTSRPGLRYYPAQDLTVAVPAITSRLRGDVYASLIGVDDSGATATVRLAINPLVWLVWLGGAVTAAGSLLAMGRRPIEQSRRPDRQPVLAGAR